jgi:hypothetical protein
MGEAELGGGLGEQFVELRELGAGLGRRGKAIAEASQSHVGKNGFGNGSNASRLTERSEILDK